MKTAFNPDALIEMFAGASAKQGEQLRQAVCQATVGALQGRELSLKNIRQVLKTVTQAASIGLAQNQATDAEALLERTVAGIDDALLKAVDANRVALQQFAEQGIGVQEKQLKKAVEELEKIEDTFIGAVRKAAEGAGAPFSGAWNQVIEKMQAGGTMAGAQAATTAEQFATQVQTAMRDSRAAGLRAAQALAQSYTALVSGVLIGMSDALQQGGAAAGKSAAAKKTK